MNQFQRINPAQAADMFDSSAAAIIDIRDPASYAEGHIPGAVMINNSNIQQFVEDTAKETPVIVCCYHGHASQQGAAFLTHHGFAEVYSLDGGFVAWAAQFPDRIER
ncbi:thiosulfate sulfurtransferase GlpE [Granulosicoccaceae sp. 1_MG-2023]|nr:thiosulfate sulfurtransferase GlpE [Granulosicoccaceae sp. 1_MG-2023]